jgi:restriction endonuclease S subunit
VSGWPIFSLHEIIERGWVELGRGKVISKLDIAAKPGPYPIYSSAKDGDGKFGEYGEYLFDEELITWSVDGGGRLFYRPKHKFSVTNVGGFLRIIDRSVFDYKYLWYALTLAHSRVVFDWVKKAHPSTIRKEYNNIPVPTRPEQQRIAAILDEAFAGIAKATANVERNIASARELFATTLARSMKPENAATSHGSTTKQEWTETTLGETCEMYQPRTISTKEMVANGEFPVFGANGQIGFYDKYNHERPEILVTCRGATCGTVNVSLPRSWVTGNAMVVRPKDNRISQDFLRHLLQGGIDLSKAITGAAQPQITRTNLNPLRFCYPADFVVQQKIVATLEEASAARDQLATIYTAKLASLSELRASLLHRAFTGQLNNTSAVAA